MKIEKIIEHLKTKNINNKYNGSIHLTIDKIVSWSNFEGNGMTFNQSLLSSDYEKWKPHSTGVIICSLELEKKLNIGSFLFVENPKLVFIELMSFFIDAKPAFIHPTAIISNEAKIGAGVSIGAYSVLGNCVIEEGTAIGSNVAIEDDTVIGKNVVILNNVSIGISGLGDIRDDNGNLVTFPHIGSVVIEDDVWIGSSVIIHKGTLSKTEVHIGSRIGSGSIISHNCIVGKMVCIASGVIIAGSARIGDYSFLGSGSYVRDKVKLSEWTTVGAFACVVNNVLERKTTIIGPKSRSIGKMFGWGQE